MIRTVHINQKEDGFILVTLAILLIVIGLALSAYAYTSKIHMENKRAAELQDSFSTVMGSMAEYISREGHNACPAPIRGVSEGDADYGKASDCTDVASVADGDCGVGALGYCVRSNSGKRIRFGVVPYKDLKIDKKDAADPYGNLLTYVLVESQGGFSTFDPTGTAEILVINDTSIEYDPVTLAPTISTIVANSDLVLFSHGADERGSFTLSGTPNGHTCTGAGKDIENCNLDHIFNIDLVADADGANHYDDFLTYNIAEWTYIWADSTDATTDNIFNQMDRDVGLGTNDPQNEFHVQGGDVLVEAGNVLTPEYCDDPSGVSCFDPDVLGGEVADGEGMDCGGLRLMTGIQNAGPKCAGFMPNLNVSCPTGEYLRRLRYDESSDTFTIIDCQPL